MLNTGGESSNERNLRLSGSPPLKYGFENAELLQQLKFGIPEAD